MKRKKHPLLVGSHLSIARGFSKTVDEAVAIGANCFQIFSKSNQQWYARPIENCEAELFKEKVQKAQIVCVVVHACYLLNLGSANKELYEKSIQALIVEIERCHQLGINFLVLHPGTAGATNRSDALDRVSSGIIKALKATEKSKVMILLENNAGQGTGLCNTIEELASLYKSIRPKTRIGICIDTCHAFAAGYALHTPEGYKNFWEIIEEKIGIEKIKIIHTNDSLKSFDSHVDRHTHIGKGEIGKNFFKELVNDPRFILIPKILETPHETEYGDVENIEVLKKLFNEDYE